MDDLRSLPPLDAGEEEFALSHDGIAPDSEDAPERRRTRGWYAVRILALLLLGFFLIVGWLAVTAPLSKSLQPVSPPQITLLAPDGPPIPRHGAIAQAPRAAATLTNPEPPPLPPLTTPP